MKRGQVIGFIKKKAYSFLYQSGLLSHSTSVDWSAVRVITNREGEIRPIYNCSNILYHVFSDKSDAYFRPILHHHDLYTTICDSSIEYFTSLYPGMNREWEEVQKALNNHKRYKKLKNIGKYSDPYSLARKFYLSKDTSIVGIETPPDLIYESKEWKEYVSNIDHYLKYLMDVIARQRRNSRSGKWEFFNANRQLSTEVMARMIGVDHLIPHSEFAILVLPDGSRIKGTVMDQAKGVETEGISGIESKRVSSPSLQRELTSLSVLDAITFERDHRPGNYNIILDCDGKVSNLSVFDNDSEMTFAPLPLTLHSGSGSSNIINKGVFNRPYLDYNVANRILQLKRKEVQGELKPYLNYIQIMMCWRRIFSLKKAIIKKIRIDKDFLLEPNQWSEKTIAEELSGKYGRTYLDTFVNYEKYFKEIADYYCAPITLS